MKIFTFVVLSCQVSQLEEAFLQHGNIDKCIKLLHTQQTTTDYLITYWIKKHILKDMESALEDMVHIEKKDERLFSLLHIAGITNKELYVRDNNLVELLIKIGDRTRTQFLENPYNFKPKLEYNLRTKSRDDVIRLVYSMDKNVLNIFFFRLDIRQISLKDVIPQIMYLSNKGNASAHGYLGEAYYYGFGLPQNIDRAMYYYIKGKSGGDNKSYVGIGRILMSEEYKDHTGAKEHLEMAKGSGDSDYLLYVLYKDYFKMNKAAYRYLLKGINMGNMPSLYADGFRYFKKGDMQSAITRLTTLIDYDELIVKYQAEALSKYLQGEYKSSLFNLLLSVELGSESSIKNTVWLLERHRCLKNQDEILFNLYKKSMYTNFEYLNKVGDCFYYGKGVDQSYTNAFSYYLVSSAYKNVEGIFNLSFMYERGYGTHKDLFAAYRQLRKIKLSENDYLLYIYIYIYFVLRVVAEYALPFVLWYVVYRIN